MSDVVQRDMTLLSITAPAQSSRCATTSCRTSWAATSESLTTAPPNHAPQRLRAPTAAQDCPAPTCTTTLHRPSLSDTLCTVSVRTLLRNILASSPDLPPVFQPVSVGGCGQRLKGDQVRGNPRLLLLLLRRCGNAHPWHQSDRGPEQARSDKSES